MSRHETALHFGPPQTKWTGEAKGSHPIASSRTQLTEPRRLRHQGSPPHVGLRSWRRRSPLDADQPHPPARPLRWRRSRSTRHLTALPKQEQLLRGQRLRRQRHRRHHRHRKPASRQRTRPHLDRNPNRRRRRQTPSRRNRRIHENQRSRRQRCHHRRRPPRRTDPPGKVQAQTS